MNAVARLLRRLRYLLRLRSRDAELAEELEFHRELKLRELRATDTGADEASSATRRAMGNVTLMREDARAVWVRPWLESAMQDLAYAFRGLRRQPRFAAAAIATLGIAIGVNASVFTTFNSTFLRAWPVADPATLYQVSTIRNGRERISDFSLEEYRASAEKLPPGAELVAMACTEGFYPGCDVRLDDALLRPAYVSANAFHALRVGMARGQAFFPEQDRQGAPDAVAILGYALWQRKFAGDPAMVGRQVRLDGIPFTVVGVAPAGFAGTSIIRTDIWLPLASLSLLRKRDVNWRNGGLQLVVRGTAGTSPQDLRGGIESVIRGMRTRQPASARGAMEGTTTVRLSPTSLDPNPVKRLMAYALYGLMFVGSGLVILLACANLASLHLARAAARAREIAVRASIGASRARIVRQLLTEGFVLAGAASALGLVVAWLASSQLLAWMADAPLSGDSLPDITVFGYAVVLAFGTCLAFSLAPALQATRRSMGDGLRGRYGFAGVNLSLRQKFLGAQVAVSVIVLCGAVFLVRGAARAATYDFGFGVADVSAINVTLPATQDSMQSQAFARALTTAVATSASRQFVGITTRLPFEGGQGHVELLLRPGQDSASGSYVQTLAVSPGYFDVLHVRLAAGRALAEADAGRGVVLINEALARKLWPGTVAVGQAFIAGTPREVIGVVRDADTDGVAPQEGSARPMIYEPLGEARVAPMPSFLVRSGAERLIADIGEVARRLVPEARVTVETLSRRLGRRQDEGRRLALLVASLGVTALILVSIGVFGVFAYVVQQRTREIGIRMALGARGGDVVRVIIASSARPMLIGLGLGFLASLAETRLLRWYLWGLSPLDPVSYVGVVVVLAVAALIAVWLPARRATRIDPVVALRTDDG
ncbi:MAG TPA: ABC transporter permease [Gemmatimonadaceae bacterium]|nr:ABC transporter permease [Gemmatimonadaceae bacterium]